jgi:hypothetical protein
MLARVLSAAVNGIEAFPVEVEVNSGWGDTTVVMLSCNLPTRPSRYEVAIKGRGLTIQFAVISSGNELE